MLSLYFTQNNSWWYFIQETFVGDLLCASVRLHLRRGRPAYWFSEMSLCYHLWPCPRCPQLLRHHLRPGFTKEAPSCFISLPRTFYSFVDSLPLKIKCSLSHTHILSFFLLRSANLKITYPIICHLKCSSHKLNKVGGWVVACHLANMFHWDHFYGCISLLPGVGIYISYGNSSMNVSFIPVPQHKFLRSLEILRVY